MYSRDGRGSSDDGDDEESSHGNHRSRARVAEQIEALKSLIPNSTGMDEKSVLEETLDYLIRIHNETEEIEKEMGEPSSSTRQRGGGEEEDSSLGPHILHVEVEELMEGRFVVKMEWRRREGIGAHVQRVMEGLDLKMISILINQKSEQIMSSIAFVEVKNEMRMTEQELRELIIRGARRSGLLP